MKTYKIFETFKKTYFFSFYWGKGLSNSNLYLTTPYIKAVQHTAKIGTFLDLSFHLNNWIIEFSFYTNNKND